MYRCARSKKLTDQFQSQYHWASQKSLECTQNYLLSHSIQRDKPKYKIQLNMKSIRSSKNELNICPEVQLPRFLKNIDQKWQKENATQLFEMADLNIIIYVDYFKLILTRWRSQPISYRFQLTMLTCNKILPKLAFHSAVRIWKLTM